MEDETNLSTDVSTALTPAVGANTAPPATPGGDTGVAQVAQQALDQSTTGQVATTDTDPIEAALGALPADDNDLASIPTEQHRQALTSLRGQLRTIGAAYRQLKPLEIYQKYGTPQVVENRLRLAQLLYTPVKGRDGQPVRDPNTQTVRITTRPFVEYLDKSSPGLPEQLLVDLLALSTENPDKLDANGDPVKEPLVNQVFAFYKLDFNRLPEYQNIDAQIVRSSGAVTPEELAEIPSEYHAAYRIIPPSIRAAWAGYEEADRTRMLEDYKAKLESADREKRLAEKERRDAERDRQAYANLVATKQNEYFATVRQERAASLIQSLTPQITFSADANLNKVMVGSLVSTMAQLLDRDWRFVVEDNVLAPLGLKLNGTFDEALSSFEENAAESVALELSGNPDRARDARDLSVTAANQLMAQLGIFILKVAKAQGATIVERAAVQAANLTGATVARPGMPNAGVVAGNGRVLPEGVRPGTPEAARALAYSTGLLRDSAA